MSVNANVMTLGVVAALLAIAARHELMLSKDNSPLRIVTTSIPDVVCGQPYRAVIQATGGKKPYSWSIVSGVLPYWAHLSTQGQDAVISGTAPAPDINGSCDGQVQFAQLRNGLGVR